MNEPLAHGPIIAILAMAAATYLTRVPGDWPVFDLAADPSTCVRFDVHAVYLGHPGADMNCPAGLVGRAPFRRTTRAVGRRRPGWCLGRGGGAEDQRY